MKNEISTQNSTTVSEVKSHVNLIQQVLNEVMKKGTHYDQIPGCGDKPVLLKPGAEKILATFNLAPEIIVEDLSTDINKFYRVVVKISHQQSGKYLGDGVGECSSLENKYAWRASVCDDEFEDFPESMRRVHYKYNKFTKKTEKVKQVRQDMHTLGNTILKMAKKRALVDACMNVTACSDIFDQDIDEPHLREALKDTSNAPSKPTFQQPANQPVNGPNQVRTITDKQVKLFWAKLNQFGLSMDFANEVCTSNSIDKIDQLPADSFNALLQDMESRKQG